MSASTRACMRGSISPPRSVGTRPMERTMVKLGSIAKYLYASIMVVTGRRYPRFLRGGGRAGPSTSTYCTVCTPHKAVLHTYI